MIAQKERKVKGSPALDKSKRQWVSVREAAEILGMSLPQTVRYCKLGAIPAWRVGSTYRVHLSDITKTERK